MPSGVYRRCVVFAVSALLVSLAAASSAVAQPAPTTTPSYPVGLKQVELVDNSPDEGIRHLSVNVFYPANPPTESVQKFTSPFFVGLDIDRNLEPVSDGQRHPLVLFSHGRGSNGLQYAWFAQALASRGYIVAALDHYRANSYESSIVYLASKLWQRPRDLSLVTNFLLADSYWGTHLDPNRIGVAGHSQGGFTALWIGGATVNAQKYLEFQEGWKNNLTVPAFLRAQLPVDPGPALDVADPRIKAVFAMAPGIIQAFGMDEAGLQQLKVPTYIAVGARDTQTPADDNAEFAADHIPGAELVVLPGDVDHEIFVNECNQIGRDEFPEACIDAPGVDRAAIHRTVEDAALRFFGVHLAG